MKRIYNVNDIVNQDLCTGCGICVSEAPKDLKMGWNEYGFLVPKQMNDVIEEDAIRVCPFNINPNEKVKDEDKLADIFLNETQNRNNKIGRFENIYVGHSNKFRKSSSSGGIATYIFEKLLKSKIVDYLYIVKEVNGSYEYQLFSNCDKIKQISKTQYIPVTLEQLFLNINNIEGKIAISGVACFIKAIRLKQYYHPKLKEKIPFLVGIICGGIKSRFFTDYLAQKTGISSNYSKQDYRIKDIKSQASDYSFGAYDDVKSFKQIKMKSVGDMWGTGMFKANACDFCDDVTTELADISLGDAWLTPYNNDGRGTSVIVTRTGLADQLIKNGIDNRELNIEALSLERFLISQQGSFNHRHNGLSVRLKQARKRKKSIPPKRFGNKKITFDFKIVQKIRMIIRKKSLIIWKETNNAIEFDKKMRLNLNLLKTATRVYHHKKRLLKIFNKK